MPSLPTAPTVPTPSPAPRLPLLLGTAGQLRRLSAADLADFQAYRALPELGRYQGWSVMSADAARAFLAEMGDAALFTPGQWHQLGIADARGERLLGDIGLHLSADGGCGELGFTLSPAAQGRGLATAAAAAALGLLWALTPAQRVRGVTDARNGPSIRLLERLGFVREAVRETVFRGEPCTEWDFVRERPASG